MALKKEITEQIKDLLRQNPNGLSITAIVRQIPINRNTAGRYLENLMVSGQVEMRHFGMAKIYSLAQRVPLSAMLSISSELIMLLDTGRRVIYANGPMLAFLETNQKDLYGKNIEFTPCLTAFDDAFDHLKRRIQSGIGGKEWSGEVAAKNGTIVFNCRIAPAVFEEGQRGVSILLENITERKNAETAIRESEETLRSIADNSPDMILLTSLDGEVLFINHAFSAPREQILHRPVFELIPKKYHSLAAASFEQAKTTGTPVVYKTDSRLVNGEVRWLESTVGPVLHGKEVVALVINGRDITDRVLAEQELRESEDRYRTLAETSPDPIFIHQDDHIVYMNPATRELTGIMSLPQKVPTGILKSIPPELSERVRENIRKDLNGELTSPIELPLVRPDGTQVIVEGRGVRTTVDGRPAVQVTMRDITERKKTEEALRESEATARALINAPTDKIILTDTKGQILDLNDAAAISLGKTREELIGASPSVVLPTGIAGPRIEMMNAVSETGNARRFIDERSGVWFDNVIYPVFNPQGEVIRLAIVARDITELKRAEAALQKSEAEYRTLAETSPDIIFMIGPDDRILYVNSYAAANLGKTADQIIGMTRSELFTGEMGKRQADRLQEAFRSGQQVRSEGAMPVKGDLHWFDHFLVPIQGPDGKVSSVLGISRDITDRRRAEESLRRSEERLRSIIENSTNIFYSHDTEYRFTYVSPQFEAILGYSTETAGLRWTNITTDNPANREGLERTERAIATGIRQPPYEVEVFSRDGRRIWLEVNETPVIRNGKTVSIVGAAQDITAKKQAQQALSKSEERYRGLITTIPDIVWEADLDRCLVYISPSAEQVLGYHPDELIGHSPFEFLDPETKAASREVFDNAARNGEPFIVNDSHWLHKDGHVVILETHARPIYREDGSVIGLRGIDRDVTEQRKTEQALFESEKRFHDLADMLPQNVWECDINGRLTFANRHSFEMYRYAPEDIEKGLYVWQMIHPVDRERVTGDFIEALKHSPAEFPAHHEYTAVRSDGSTFPVIMYHVPIVKNNTISGMRGIGIDLTERMQIEEALRETTRAFRLLAENSVDIISRILPDGTCAYVSPAVRWSLGYEPEELTGTSALEYLHPDDHDRVLEMIREFGSNGHNTGIDTFRIRHKDGSYVWFEATIRATRNEKTGEIAEFTMVSRAVDARNKSS